MNTQQATLILIPGLLSDAVVWQPTADAIGKTMPVVIADVRAGISLTKMAEVLLVENPGQLYLAGHSMGARVALEMVRLAPDRIEKLAMIDTGVHPAMEGEAAQRQVQIDLAYEQGMGIIADQWLPPMVDKARHGDEVLMGLLKDMVLRTDAQQLERQIKGLLARSDAALQLPHITCPVLVVAGHQDTWSPLSQHEDMHALLPNSRLIGIDNAGHFAPIERPEAIIEALQMWIKGWD